MCAIDDDAQPVQPQPAREALLDELDIPTARVVEPLGTAQLGRGGPVRRPLFEALLDAPLQLIRQLIAVTAKQLDAIVAVGIVRGGDDDADIGAQAARQHRDRRGRQRSDQDDIHPHRDKAGGQRRLEHVTR